MEERKKEKSCGIIVFDDKNRVLMVKHKEGHYGFPKGHVEPNETENETALREVKEETNCDVEIIDGFREENKYSPRENVDKTVVLFVGRPTSFSIKNQESETDFADFVSLKEAHVLLEGYKDVIEIFDKAIKFMEEKKLI